MENVRLTELVFQVGAYIVRLAGMIRSKVRPKTFAAPMMLRLLYNFQSIREGRVDRLPRFLSFARSSNPYVYTSAMWCTAT